MLMANKRISTLGALLLRVACAVGLAAPVQPEPGQQVNRAFTSVEVRTNRLQYLLYTPKDYNPSDAKRWPLVLFLHGSGERGTNVDLVAVHGPPKLVKQGREFPFILVSPQCRPRETWRHEELSLLLDELEVNLRVDKNREYVTGLSMGGYGTWDLAAHYPQRFAAVAPICGGGDRLALKLAGDRLEALKTLGVWAFHGGKDPTVPLAESQQMVEEFHALGNSSARLTVYPEAGHDSWTEAYNTQDLYDWLASHSR